MYFLPRHTKFIHSLLDLKLRQSVFTDTKSVDKAETGMVGETVLVGETGVEGETGLTDEAG